MPSPLAFPWSPVSRYPLAAEEGGLQEVLDRPCGDEDPSPACDWVLEQTGNEVLAAAVGRLFEPALEAALIVLLAFVASRMLRRAIDHAVEEMKDEDEPRRWIAVPRRKLRLAELEGTRRVSRRRVQRADALGALGKSVGSAVVWVTAVFMVLGAFGLNLGPLIASAGIVGVALGFGSQALVRDFLSGVFMLVEDQYGVGDIVDVGEAAGVVEGVGLRTTRVRDVAGTLWHVPNGEIRRVGNMSQDWARVLLDVEVAYGTDLDTARDLILEVATSMAVEPEYADQFVEEPEVWGVEQLGADGISIRLVAKVVPASQWALMRELRRRIKALFDERGIEIPFPQRTIWVRSDGEANAGPTPAATKKATAKKAATKKAAAKKATAKKAAAKKATRRERKRSD